MKSLYFKEGGYCSELNMSYKPGYYSPKDEQEYKILAKYAGVEIEEKINNYDGFKQGDFDVELAKRGIDFKALGIKSNKDKKELLLKDDARN